MRLDKSSTFHLLNGIQSRVGELQVREAGLQLRNLLIGVLVQQVLVQDEEDDFLQPRRARFGETVQS